MEAGGVGVWRSKRVIKKTAEVHRIFLKEESRAQIKKVKWRNCVCLLLMCTVYSLIPTSPSLCRVCIQ